MKKDKVYFPISDDIKDMVAITGSHSGLVFPIRMGGINQYHVTFYTKKIEEGHVFNIHVTDEVKKVQHEVLNLIVTQEQLDALAVRFEGFGEKIKKMLLRHFKIDDNVQTEDLHCIECAFSDFPVAPITYERAQEFWSIFSSMDEAVIISTKKCENLNHISIYDSKSKSLRYRTSDGKYVMPYPEDLFADLEVLIKEEFGPEIAIIENIFNEIKTIVSQTADNQIA